MIDGAKLTGQGQSWQKVWLLFGGRCICALLVVPFGEGKAVGCLVECCVASLLSHLTSLLENFDACFWLLGEWYVNKCLCQWVTGLHPKEVSRSA